MGSLIDGEQAVKNGASFITHLFNAMLPVSALCVFCYIGYEASNLFENLVSPSRSRFDWFVSLIKNSGWENRVLWNNRRWDTHTSCGTANSLQDSPRRSFLFLFKHLFIYYACLIFMLQFLRISGLVLVTDAMGALGLEPGTYKLGEQECDVKETCAVLAGTNTLCGSIATMDKCVRHFKEATGWL